MEVQGGGCSLNRIHLQRDQDNGSVDRKRWGRRNRVLEQHGGGRQHLEGQVP